MLAKHPTLKVSEVFQSIQGEGISVGERCLFVRLAHCNLSCHWCDTPYSWDFTRYDVTSEVHDIALTELATRITVSGEQRLVVTGGEPLIQQKLLQPLFESLPQDLLIEIETNGTLLPNAALLSRVDQWNISPKLCNSGEPFEKRWRPDVLAALSNTDRAWLKFVVAGDDDCHEAMALLSSLPVPFPKDRVLFMPLSRDVAELRKTSATVARACVEHGTRFSPRRHLELFDGARGH